MSAVRTAARPVRPALLGVGWRAALVVVAAVAVALEAPAWARLPLSAAAVVAVATLLLRRRRALDGVLVVAGGGIVALALLGLVLNLLPFGLGPVGWGVAVGVLELAVLAVVARRSPVERPAGATPARRRVPVAGIAWGAAAAAVLAGAIVYSAASYDATHVAPVAIAAEPEGAQVTLTVSAGDAAGPFDLDLVSADGRTVLARSIDIAAGEVYTTTIPAPTTRSIVQLVPAGSTTPLRQLILDDAAEAAR